MAGQQGISLARAKVGGGLIDDVNVEILDAKFVEYDYDGSVNPPVLALAVELNPYDGGEDAKPSVEYLSAGALTRFVPSEDGSMAVPVGDAQLLNDNCNAIKFLFSALEQGFPEDLLEAGDVTTLVGMKCHILRVEAPKRQGLIRGGKNADRPQTTLTVSSIIELPGAGGPTGGKKAVSSPKPAAGARPATARPAQAASARPATTTRATAPRAASVTTASPSKANGRATPATARPVAGKAAAGTAAAGQTAEPDPRIKVLAMQVLTTMLSDAEGNPIGPVATRDVPKNAFNVTRQFVKAGTMTLKDQSAVSALTFDEAFLTGLAKDGMVAYDGATVELLPIEAAA